MPFTFGLVWGDDYDDYVQKEEELRQSGEDVPEAAGGLLSWLFGRDNR